MTLREKLEKLIDRFTVDIRKAFIVGIQGVADSVILKQVIEAIELGDVEAAFRRLGFSQAAMRQLTAALERAFEEGGVFAGTQFPKFLNTPSGRAVFRFDVRNSRAEAFLRDRSSTLITAIGDDIRENVRTVLQAGMTEGRNPRSVALDIVGRVDQTGTRVGGTVGLTAGQEGWVQSARRRLLTLDEAYFNMELRDKRFDGTVRKAIETNKPLPRDIVDKLTTRYRSNALKYRGDMIGRTEAIQSLNASEYEALKQAVDMGAISADAIRREWDATLDTRTRFSHIMLNGQTRGLDEPFVSPVTGGRMRFPGDTSLGAPARETINCRCRIKSKADWFADID